MQIVIPAWMKEENPMTAGFCELINETLKNSPNMTLEEFAREIDKANYIEAYNRLVRVEKAQLSALPCNQ